MLNSSLNHTGTRLTRGGGRGVLLEYSHLITWSVVYILIALFAVIGNVLIIVVFSKKRRLRTRTNYFVVGLAAADVIVGTVTIPLWVTFVNLLYNGSFLEAARVKEVFSPMDIFSGMLSILHLMIISLERVYAIAFPLRHRISNPKWNFLILAVTWILGASVSALNFFLPQGGQWKGTFLVYSALGFFIPFSIISISYMSIIIVVKRRTSMTRRRAMVVKRESRTAVTIFALILLFLATWLPFFSLNLVLYTCRACASVVTFNMVLFFKALHYLGSALNPVVYSARSPEFRRPITLLLKERRFQESFYRGSTTRRSYLERGSRRDRELSDVSESGKTGLVSRENSARLSR
ncbi:predicted protein [Nematostella vectensis]|uniref:G-protein coupled receptors family 1 profile domain-containing protein n=1 Tax=Nematostella vectensis TaxID=45351 RepID=A7SL25_NEMVE|nr:octopamine receptor beta-2R [Nematostella vectensis]XP_032231386.1 octopamine receptor beta-2R [Nematostella vectensis]XP_032231387.1 octopamine receptor beta-2R [Nematostella vectensis]EDO35584.1 predicted protein [Nematostella vectensis]|eukprot:XP_001627684.1 predicted protein [Nematostella vectensis]